MVKKFLLSKPVLWFLCLFNLLAAAIVPFAVDGSQGVTAAIGMGLVSLKAGIGLLWKKRAVTQGSRSRAAQI
ncbi:hypothetical protein AB0G32_12795 [Streptomyces sp. NPDC023723]|uniref:hypothetical protein n=1 Tax=Streptomyces sp. NPDC023723 TaxID=3154323 RepID=UPI0033DFCD91